MLAVAAAALLSVLVSAPAHAVPPEVTFDYNSVDTVYPAPDGYVDTIKFTWTVSPQPVGLTLEVMKIVPGLDPQAVRTLTLDPATTTYTWNGRTDAGALAGAGDYFPRVMADNGTDPISGSAGWQFAVSAKRLVSKTWTKSLSASGSLKDKQVGACSTLRKPGKMLGAGSLGYYSLARCRRTSNGAGDITTIHGVTLPAAFRPGKVRFSVYSGAVKRGGAVGFVPLSRSVGAIGAGTALLGPARAWHTTPAVAASQMLRSDRRIMWGIAALAHSRYDVKTIKVIYSYQILQ
ncbi:hypothetical protein GCM10028772_09450 [Nocardioides ultimimeridianus]